MEADSHERQIIEQEGAGAPASAAVATFLR
jgi:hypothetical protein